MGEQFWVDTDGLDRSSAGYTDASGSVRAVVEALEAAIAPLQGCWGNDKAGKRFEQSGFLSIQDSLMDAVAHLAKVLGSTAEGVQQMAAQFAAAEERNTDLSGGVGKVMKQVADPGGGAGNSGGISATLPRAQVIASRTLSTPPAAGASGESAVGE
jgi:uncharacterized protein YukE